jgi:GNAT superfamily N-acetyltransferase
VTQPSSAGAPAPSDVAVRRFEAVDEPAVLELLEHVFGGWPAPGRGDASEHFGWKHRQSPFGPSVMSVAEVDGAVAGFHALMRWRLHAGDRVVHAVRGTDIAVRPEFRGRGVAGAMVTASLARRPPETEVGFSNPNGMSAPVSIRLGRRPVGPFRFLVRPRRPLRLLAGPLRRCAAIPDVDAAPAAEALADAELAAWIETLPRSGNRLASARDLEYLRWRYGARPGYWAVRTGPVGDPSGLAVFGLAARGTRWAQVICELLVGEGDAQTARDLVRRTLGATAADFATCLPAPGSAAAGAAIRRGFFPSRHRHAIHVNPIVEGTGPDPTERGSWALSCGDLELL